jgi:hypothetical protein
MRPTKILTGASYPAVHLSDEELTAIRRGRAAFRRGDYVPLKEILDELGPSDQATDERR